MSAATKIRFIYDRPSFVLKRVIVPEIDDDELDFHEPAEGEGAVDARRENCAYAIANFPPPERLHLLFLQAMAAAL